MFNYLDGLYLLLSMTAKRMPHATPISIDALDTISYWGEVISAQRKVRGISMRDFAYRACISLSTL